MAGDRPRQPAYKIFSIESLCIFNNLKFRRFKFKESSVRRSQIWVLFKVHYYFIACCTLIAYVAGPLLSRISWALLSLLVNFLFTDYWEYASFLLIFHVWMDLLWDSQSSWLRLWFISHYQLLVDWYLWSLVWLIFVVSSNASGYL